MSQPVCVLCAYYHPRADLHRPDQGNQQTCGAGRRRLEHDLLNLRATFLRLQEDVAVAEPGANDAISQLLPGAPTPSPSNQPRVSGSKERRLPIDVTRVDLLAPATPDYVRDPLGDQIGRLSVADVLNEWVAAWHDRWYHAEWYPGSSAVSLIDWISGVRLYWIADRDDEIAKFADELSQLRSALYGALGEIEPRPQPAWGIPCPRCSLASQLMLHPEDPDHYRECASCGLRISPEEYAAYLRGRVEQYRTDPNLARG